MEQYQDAIAFAEAGEQAEAQQFFKDVTEDDELTTRLLVVGHGNDFSQEIIEYALEMASRLEYQEIIALNAAPIGFNSLETLDAEQRKLQKEFKESSEQNIKKFREAAQKAGIRLSQVIKFKDIEDALEEIKHEMPGIEFVISDLAETSNELRPEEHARPYDHICVYSMV